MRRKNIFRAARCALCLSILGLIAVSETGCVPAPAAGHAEPCRSYAMTAGRVALRSETLAGSGICVGSVSGGKKTDPRRVSNIGNVGLREALEYSLSRNGLWAEDGEYVLDVAIVREDVRQEGALSIVEARVFYSLRGRFRGNRVFEKTIISGGQAASSDALGGARLRVAKERAMKMNIENFFVALDRAFLKKERGNAD